MLNINVLLLVYNKLTLCLNFYINTHLAVADLANCTIKGLSFKI